VTGRHPQVIGQGRDVQEIRQHRGADVAARRLRRPIGQASRVTSARRHRRCGAQCRSTLCPRGGPMNPARSRG